VFFGISHVSFISFIASFEAFKAVIFQVAVLCVVMSYGVVVGYQRFRRVHANLHLLKMVSYNTTRRHNTEDLDL